MAWPDGSRFLIANGVKWGTGPKFYYGPSHDHPVNHDQNWSSYCNHSAQRDASAASQRMVQTPAKDGIAPLLNPGTMVFRPSTSSTVASAARANISSAGRSLLSSSLAGGTPKRPGSGMPRSARSLSRTGSGILRPHSAKEIAALKSTVKAQAEAQEKTEARVKELTSAILELKAMTEAAFVGGSAPPGARTTKAARAARKAGIIRARNAGKK